MANELRYGIGFDLKSAVDITIKEWNDKEADRLEKAIQRRAINVKLALDDKKVDYTKLEDIKRRLEGLKIEPITPQTKQAINDLARELQALAKALEQVQKYSASRGSVTPDAVRAAKIAQQEALTRSKQAVEYEKQLLYAKKKEAQEIRNQQLIDKGNGKLSQRTNIYKEHSTYLSRLTQRMAAYWSVQQIGNFLTKVREITAQFELQRVSLGAIINDQNRANELFSEIKQFALKSPIQIMDLTRYTKQLAAYRVETDNLFETTKRLADVAVGLGGNGIMERLILAYGETKATNVMNAKELRQFAFMGIPMLELLSEKLSEIKGKAISTGETFEMIKKRMVHFDIVKQVFEDLTSAGGTFYNMQEKQGNTLYGMWAKLGDAASVMYDQIGNTDAVNSAMRGSITLMSEMMRNWKAVGKTIATIGLPIMLAIPIYKKYIATQALATAATQARINAEIRLNSALEKGNADEIANAEATLANAKAKELAAKKTTGLAASAKSVGLSLVKGLGIGLAISAVTMLIYKIYEAYENAHRLQNQIKEIRSEGDVVAMQSARNFEFLADKAVFAKSLKEQKDALDELKRTYKDSLPIEAMSIENLTKLREGASDATTAYAGLTQAIKEYIYQQQKQKELNAIDEEFGKRMINARAKLYEFFKENNISDTERGRFFAALEEETKDTSKTIEEQLTAAFKKAGIEGGKELANKILGEKSLLRKSLNLFEKLPLLSGLGGSAKLYDKYIGEATSYIQDYVDANNSLITQRQAAEDFWSGQTGYVGAYSKELENVKKHMEDFVPTDANGNEIKQSEDYYAYQKAVTKEQIQQWADLIIQTLKSKGVEIQNEWFNLAPNEELAIEKIAVLNIAKIIEALGNGYVEITQLLNAIQNDYSKLVPSNRTVVLMTSKLEQLTAQFGLNMNQTRQYLMDAEEDISKYAKRIKESLEEAQTKLKELAKQRELINSGVGKGVLLNNTIDKIKEETELTEKEIDFLKALMLLLGDFTETTGGKQSDPRLQNIKEEISLTKKLYDEYNKLEKQIGKTKAAEKVQSIYANTIKTLQERAGKYGFEFELPFTDDNLKANMQHFIDKMKDLQRLTDKKGKPLFPNIGKDIDEAVAQLEDVDLNSLQKTLEQKLKDLADRISRTKNAKEFYDKILSQTGDVDLAANVSLAIYGDTGKELFKNTIEQIREVFKSGNADVDLKIGSEIDNVIDLDNERINYGELAKIYEKYQDQIIEKNRDTASKIVSEGQKTAANNVLTWQKELEKAKSFEQQRTDIIKTETERRNAIIKSDQKQSVKDKLIGLSYEKQAQELAKLSIKEFKDSDDYIKVFQDLDRVSSQTLDRMKKRLEEMIKLAKDTENVEGLKSLVEQLDKIKEERETRNPIEGVISSFKEYAKARKDYQTAQANEATAKAEFARQETQLNQEIAEAKTKQEAAQARVNDLQKQGLLETNEGVTAQLALNDATTKVANAEKKRANAVKKVNEAEQDTTDALDAQKTALTKLQKNVNAMANAFNSAASSIKTIADMMGVAEDSELGDIVNGLVSGLQNAATIMTTILAIAIAIESACWWLLAIGAAVSAFTAIGSWLTGAKVRKANKEIERQQKLLDQLEYTYSRLEKAAEKAFGGDYINNFKQQQKNLQAQQLAYEKQLEAEKSKGKKADDEKIKEYEEKIRDVKDEIADIQGTIAEKMLGTDLTSAARDFAQAWLDAYKEFGNTTDKMSEKFHEMIQNMVVEGALAKVMERALQPMFDMIDNMGDQDFYSESFWKTVVDKAEQGAKDADYGAQTMMKFLEKAGISMRDLGGELTGISRDVAGASEESINGLAAGINTQNYYMSQVPGIAANVAIIRQLMESGNTSPLSSSPSSNVDFASYHTESLAHLNTLTVHSSQILAECKRLNEQTEKAVTQLNRVIVPRGAKGSHGVQVYIN